MTDKDTSHSATANLQPGQAIPVTADPKKTLSGSSWCSSFPGSTSADDLNEPFRENFYEFYAALEESGCSLNIAATLRPQKRAYLMHYSWEIHHNKFDYKNVPSEEGVDIEWDHGDEKKSRAAASDMCATYRTNGPSISPSRRSRHTEGSAVDMSVTWSGELSISQKDGTIKKITSDPKNGMNKDLQEVAAAFGVIKFNVKGQTDMPHWSINGT